MKKPRKIWKKTEDKQNETKTKKVLGISRICRTRIFRCWSAILSPTHPAGPLSPSFECDCHAHLVLATPPATPWPMRYPALPLVQQQLIDLIINSNPNSSWICLYCLYISHQSFFMLITWVCLQKNKNPSFLFLRNWKSASSEFVRINTTIHFWSNDCRKTLPSMPEAFLIKTLCWQKVPWEFSVFYQIMKNHHILLLLFFSISSFCCCFFAARLAHTIA